MSSSNVERNVPLILTFGKKILELFPEIKSSRKMFEYNFNINHFENPDESNENIRLFLVRNLGFTEEQSINAIIIHKNIKPVGLTWHIDDCQLVKYKKDKKPVYNLDQYILLDTDGEKLVYLYFNTPTKKLPKFTILFYSSTYGIDFDGGILTLADGTQIKSKKNYGFIVDSREAHMVTRITKGIRNVSVVKIY
jgi:hypothetical protein